MNENGNQPHVSATFICLLNLHKFAIRLLPLRFRKLLVRCFPGASQRREPERGGAMEGRELTKSFVDGLVGASATVHLGQRTRRFGLRIRAWRLEDLRCAISRRRRANGVPPLHDRPLRRAHGRRGSAAGQAGAGGRRPGARSVRRSASQAARDDRRRSDRALRREGQRPPQGAQSPPDAGPPHHHVVPLLGRKKISEVRVADVEQFMRDVKDRQDRERREDRTACARHRQGGAGAAAKGVRDLSAVFTFAIRQELVTANPCAPVKKPADGKRSLPDARRGRRWARPRRDETAEAQPQGGRDHAPMGLDRLPP